MLILLFLVGVTVCVPLPRPPQTPLSENAAKSSLKPTGRHISSLSTINEAYPTSTHLTPPFPNSGEVTNVHVTKEVRRVAFQIVEEVSGSKSLIFPPRNSHNTPDINLEPTEVEAPGTTPTTIPLVTTANPFSPTRNSSAINYPDVVHHPSPEANLTTSHLGEVLSNHSGPGSSPVSVTELDQYYGEPSSPASSSDKPTTPKSDLEVVPSIHETERITYKNVPAKEFKVSEDETTLKYFGVLLNDEPSTLNNKEPLAAENLSKDQPADIVGEQKESVILAEKDTLESSHINSEKKYLVTFSTEKTSPLDLENEEELVDLILGDKKLQFDAREKKDAPSENASEGPSQVGADSNQDAFLEVDPHSNLDQEGARETIKPSFIETRNAKTEAFFSISRDFNLPLNINSSTDPSNGKGKKHNKTSLESGQTETIEVSAPKENPSDNIPPAFKRNSASNPKVGGSLDSYAQLEDHPPFADVANRNPALPIEDSEEHTFLLKPRVQHGEKDIPIETRTQGYDGADENSSEEVRLHHRIHPVGPKVALQPPKQGSTGGSHESVIIFRNVSRQSKTEEILLPSSDQIVQAKIPGSSHLIPIILESESSDPILDDYTPESVMDGPRQEKVSVPMSKPIEAMSPGYVAAIVMGVLLCIAAALGGFAFIVYHRQTDIRPKVLSSDRSCANSDSGGYIDDHCRVAYVNSQLDLPKGTPEDLVSLDNDSFLNSLESMTIQNLWTDSIRHTKL